VQFLTGATALPVGGLGELHPKLTVAKRLGVSARAFPTVSTCQTYLKLPEYASKAELKDRLLVAMAEGRDSFDLA
jgi:E3 ubiquitin-protein ligase TRIP12